MQKCKELPASLVRDIKRYGYELSDGGLLIRPAGIMIGGVFDYELRRHRLGGEEVWSSPNLVVLQGRNHALDVLLHGATAISPWYIGVFEGNYTPVDGDTAATFPTSATECTAYDETTRVAYNEAAAVAGVTTNSANRAEFTFNATKTIYGAFLTSAAAKGAITGTLLAADRGSVSKGVSSGDVLLVAYSLSMTATV